ncbi:MAG: diguanylate cyclase [Desulfobacteraceae bacterium]|nr:diguanylate cyclase [Desulfobacteraceae bacterium]
MTRTPIRMLVVEDSDEDRSTYRRLLQADPDHDFVIQETCNAAEGRAALESTPLDCVLLDNTLPDMDGLAFLQSITACVSAQCTPVILLTAMGSEAVAVQAMKNGAADYLNKNTLTTELLVRAIRHALERRDDRQALLEHNARLQAANRQIVEQQKALIEEERLKVMLQMAGATAHELNQPLATLMGYIDLFELDRDDPAKVAAYMEKIREAGQRIANIAHKIQSIRPEQAPALPGGGHLITFDRDIRLLVVEDRDQDFGAIVRALANQPRIQLLRASDFAEALRLLAQQPIEAIILDYLLPSGNGLDFLAQLEKQGIETPVIFSTGHGDEMVAAKAIQSGAYDYLPKTKINADNLVRMVANTLEKHRLKNEVRQAMQAMAEMSVRDDLTGLYNRRYMNELLEREFSRAKRYNHDLSCLLLDVDFFKQVNDAFGHIFGDQVLKEFASHLKANVRDSDYCFRYGGEEFMVLLPNTSIEGANQTAEKLRAFVESHIFRDGATATHITISIGSVCLKKHRPSDERTLLAYADKALYRAKTEGRNRLKEYLEISEPPSTSRLYADVDLAYFRERLASILEKTRSASLNSLSLLMNQLGADLYKEHHRKALIQIELLGARMRLPGAVVETIKRAASIHDYLKALLPQSVLSKKDPLDPQERACIQSHAAMLAELTRMFEVFRAEREILLYHQEHYDGTGYPTGLKGEQIPLGARIYAIADAVAAMMFDRPYRQALTSRQIVEELINNAGTQFDPTLVNYFLQAVEENPTLPLSGEELALRTQWLNTQAEPAKGIAHANSSTGTD